jgi:oxygen-independent coproporphyrinogen-3 oxidase
MALSDACNQAGYAGLYLHFPYCLHKCAYCDFNSKVASSLERDRYLGALRREMDAVAPAHAGLAFDSIYFGGGTPTLFSPQSLVDVLDLARVHFNIAPRAEVTIEANPNTVDVAGLEYLRSGGFNRLSLGIQSLDDTDLRFLGRVHSARDAVSAFTSARAARFRNITVDLIRGLPHHTPDSWRRVVEHIVDLGPEHLSCYGLTLEPGTKLHRLHEQGAFVLPDDDLALALVEVTDQVLATAGFIHYEVSNWAQPGYECRHNLKYWQGFSYLGLGAGAWSYVRGRRYGNVRDPVDYARRASAGEPHVDQAEELAGWDLVAERAMLGLRLVGGVEFDSLVLGAGSAEGERLRSVLTELAGEDLVWLNNGHVGPTPRGLVLLNQVALRLLSAQ